MISLLNKLLGSRGGEMTRNIEKREVERRMLEAYDFCGFLCASGSVWLIVAFIVERCVIRSGLDLYYLVVGMINLWIIAVMIGWFVYTIRGILILNRIENRIDYRAKTRKIIPFDVDDADLHFKYVEYSRLFYDICVVLLGMQISRKDLQALFPLLLKKIREAEECGKLKLPLFCNNSIRVNFNPYEMNTYRSNGNVKYSVAINVNETYELKFEFVR